LGLQKKYSLPGPHAICPEKNSRSDLHKDDPEELPLNCPLDNFALIEAPFVLRQTARRLQGQTAMLSFILAEHLEDANIQFVIY
jgi:hypothetical protein